MKTLFIFLFVAFNFFSCNVSSLDYKPESGHEQSITSPTPAAIVCLEKNYEPKSEAEIASMTPRQLIDELVKVNTNSFDTYAELADYEDSIENRIRKLGINALPVLTEYMNAYEPNSTAYCDDLRFAQARRMSHDIDRFEFRLRGTKEGQLAIEAFERAIKRMENSGIDQEKIEQASLNRLKGINWVDWEIQRTFRINKKIEISDSELLDFSNFLTERDPTYPIWSDSNIVTDNSQTDGAGNPLQVQILKRPERFYEAYSEFKKTKSN
jgi:hypothetical protein